MHDTSWCCVDCLMLFANGETPPDDEHGHSMTEEATQAWLDNIERRTSGYIVACGGEHDEDCPNMLDGEWQGTTDCSCETREFSWSSCDTCGSPLGGSRHAVTLFPID